MDKILNPQFLIALVILLNIFLAFFSGSIKKWGRKVYNTISLFAFLSPIFLHCIFTKTLEKSEFLFLGDVFKIDSTSLLMWVLLSTFFALSFLFLEKFEKKSLKPSVLHFVFTLALMMMVTQTFLVLFCIFEIALLTTYFLTIVRSKPSTLEIMSLSSIRILGLLFLLGSVLMSYGYEQIASLSFVKDNLANLYGHDYLLSAASLLILVTSLQSTGTFRIIKSEESIVSKLLMSILSVLFLLKVSSSGLFSILNESSNLLQWVLVLGFLYYAFESFKETVLIQKIKSWAMGGLVFFLTSSLAYILDGEGDLTAPILTFTSFLLGLFALLFAQSYLVKFKQAELNAGDLKGLYQICPYLAWVFAGSCALLFGLPVTLNALNLFSALKLTIQSGFYWVALWSFVGIFIFWASVVSFVADLFVEKPIRNRWLLWESSEELLDLPKARTGVLFALFFVLSAWIYFLS